MTFFTVDHLAWSTAGSVRDDVIGLRSLALVGMLNLYSSPCEKPSCTECES